MSDSEKGVPNMFCHIGLDLSLTATGFYCKAAHGVLKPKMKGPDRLVWFWEQIGALLDEHRITHATIENYAMGIRGGRVFSIGEQGGVVRVLLQQRGIKTIQVPPTTLKKYITGCGKGDKNVILLAVFQKWGKSFNNDNIADAYALWRLSRQFFAWQTEPTGTNFLKKDVEIFQKVEQIIF